MTDRRAVEEDRPSRSGGCEQRADESGELDAAEAAETFERVPGIGCVDSDCGGDSCAFAGQTLRVEAGTASADCRRCKAGKSGEKRGGDGCVPDADLTEHEEVAACGE